MKKFLLWLAVSALCGTVFSEDVTGIVTASGLNLRMQPSLHAPVVGRSKQKDKLVITGKKGSWLEVAAPDCVKVYVSRAYVSNGKAIVDLPMRAAMANNAASLGTITKGSPVKIVSEHAYGWARIQPPATLKVYAASVYVQFDAAAVSEMVAKKAEAAKAEAKPEAKSEAKSEAKAEVKPEAPAKADAKAAAPSETPAKTEVNADVKTAAPAETPAKAETPAVEKKAAEFSEKDPRVAELRKLGIDVNKDKFEQISVSGILVPVPSSSNLATNYAVGSADVAILGFVCAAEDGMLKPFVQQNVQIVGKAFRVKDWKAPVIWLDEIDKAK